MVGRLLNVSKLTTVPYSTGTYFFDLSSAIKVRIWTVKTLNLNAGGYETTCKHLYSYIHTYGLTLFTFSRYHITVFDVTTDAWIQIEKVSRPHAPGELLSTTSEDRWWWRQIIARRTLPTWLLVESERQRPRPDYLEYKTFFSPSWWM